jgi:catechol 2,3-dioxygenase-like lactoylglutathione lyase family enzyme
MMAKLRHIAIATNDPKGTAEFYKSAFGFKEVGFAPEAGAKLGHGYFLSDGTLNLAILKFVGVDQLGKGLDYVGIHHFGVLVDDVDTVTKKLEGLGADCIVGKPTNGKGFFEVKFRGPDGVVFDISEHPWMGSAADEDAPVKESAGA